MLESVTVLADIEYPSDRKTMELEQERAGYYATIALDELRFRRAIENNDGTIPDDDEEIIRRLRKDGTMLESVARDFLMMIERVKKHHETSDLRQLLALVRVLDRTFSP